MMAESGDDANHESTFEIINAQQDANVPAAETIPPAPTGSVPNLPPPAALPAFASLSGPAFTPTPPPIPSSAPNQPAPPPKSPEGSSASHGGNPFSIRAVPAQHHQTTVAPPMPLSAPMVMMPASMTEGAPNPVFATGQQQQPGGGVEIPFDLLSHGSVSTATSSDAASAQQETGTSGVWGWFRGAVQHSPLLSKVAETAKNSMEGVIATLDPQMKEYMGNRGQVDIVITLDRDEEIRGAREGILRVFPAANIHPFVVAAGLHVAAQTIGFANALQAAQQKITYIRNSGFVDQTALIVGNEGFITEALQDTWLYFDCLVLDDATRQVQVHAFTQPVQVPNDVVQVLKDQTQTDYPFKDLGYAVSVSHAMTHLWSLGPLEWQERLIGVARMELLKNAALALAYSYRGKL